MQLFSTKLVTAFLLGVRVVRMHVMVTISYMKNVALNDVQPLCASLKFIAPTLESGGMKAVGYVARRDYIPKGGRGVDVQPNLL